MSDPIAKHVRVTIPRRVLEMVYDECDRYPTEETGGRIVGLYEIDAKGALAIRVLDAIGPGPGARRSAVTLFQDGEYQAEVFREIELRIPDIEHLGNWHTHHVNGLPTLSSGDRETYHRTVDHDLHNTDFFYALLVTAKHQKPARERYDVKHFVLQRHDSNEYEIPPSQVEVTDATEDESRGVPAALPESLIRAFDQSVLRKLQPGLTPVLAGNPKRFCWKGDVVFGDGSTARIAVLEGNGDENAPTYELVVRRTEDMLEEPLTELTRSVFSSATEAVWSIERELTRQKALANRHQSTGTRVIK